MYDILESGSNLTRMAYACDKYRVIQSRRKAPRTRSFFRTLLLQNGFDDFQHTISLHNRILFSLDYDRVKSESPIGNHQLVVVQKSLQKAPSESSRLLEQQLFTGCKSKTGLRVYITRRVGRSIKNVISMM